MDRPPVTGPSIIEQLAAFAAGARTGDIPARALDCAAMLISSTIASAAMGSSIESAQHVRSVFLRRGGVAEATPWFGKGTRLPAGAAARVNACMSDAAASDDSDLRNITHPGTTLVTTALAMAERTGATGEEVLGAIALGWEVAGRINTAVIPGLMWESGFHGSKITIFGGAVAAARLLKLDAHQLAHALALASTSIGGILAAAETSTAREHHAGLAAALGVDAAELAQAGFRAEPRILEKPRGFFDLYGMDAQATGRVAQVTQGLGQDWLMLTEMAIKLMPGGHPYHAIAEAAAQAATLGDVRAENIARIVCTRPSARMLEGPSHPDDLIGVAHSPAFFAAAGAADRQFTWDNATPRKIMDPAIRRLLDVVELKVAPVDQPEKYRQGATVSVTARSGQSFTKTVYAPRGSAIVGLEWPDIDRKLESLAPLAGVGEAAIARCHELLHDFRRAANVQPLVSLLTA